MKDKSEKKKVLRCAQRCPVFACLNVKLFVQIDFTDFTATTPIHVLPF